MKQHFTLLFCATAALMASAGNWGLEGDGTASNPYKIGSAADFRAIALNISADNTGEGEYFLMTGDVDFNGSESSPQQLPSIGRDGITTVASVQWGFNGTFDGGGHSIKGIYHTENENNKAGQFNALFSSVGPKGSISNLVFSENNYINSYNYVAPIASLCQGSIDNCENFAPVIGANAFAAGICGQLLLGTGSITNCVNHGDVYSMSYACGIVGGCQGNPAWDITTYKYVVENCVNYGNMSSKNDTGNAGIAGSFSGYIRNCTNNGEINGLLTHYQYGQYSAGVVSCASYPLVIDGCVNNGSVSGLKNSGGIVGTIMKGLGDEFVITNCINNGTVVCEGANVGGIVGYTLREQDKVSVAGCRNNAAVSTTAETDQIGNIRGNSLIALGDGNYIAEGLTLYELDGDTPTYNPNTPQNAWGLKGEGSQGNPYEIYTAADFVAIAENISADNTGEGEYFLMMNDIDFGGSADTAVQLPAIGKGGITNVANVAWGFEGVFDGGNFTVSGIYHTNNGNNVDGQFNALFASLGEHGVVKNLTFGQNNHVSSYNYAAGIVSLSKGAIENCTNEADIVAANAFAAGICGYLVGGVGTITDCVNRGNVQSMTYATGIAGGSQSGASISSYGYRVENCTNYGTMQTTNATGAAGIAGSYSGAVTGCTNYGDIDGSAKTTGQYNAGIVASGSYITLLEGCTNYGKVDGAKSTAGIIAMVMKGDENAIEISNCKNFGEVTASGEFVAGIAANTQRGTVDEPLVTLSSCANSAEVTTTAETENIGNLRGIETIALGEGNTIADGLTRYALDGDDNSGVAEIVSEAANGLKDGKYLLNGKIVVVKAGSIYTTDGIRRN